MRKLVLGIALVVCLDVAFIWMMENQAEPAEIAYAVAPHAAEPVIHDAPPIDPVAQEDEIISRTDEVFSRSQSAFENFRERGRNTRPATNPKPAIRRPVRAIEPRDPSLTAKHLFPDKIIVIGQTDRNIEAARNRDRRPETPEEKPVAVAEATGPSQISEEKNKSFESRAFSVIKKPYLWMRALASQIR